ncbi:MAG: succinate dehydrogenase, cytochrome b556 subunit [Proteobacteria bacterium]|nr:succinate dehydrogenase, cytochrome b556 subunit [Pseudomonadota bacterium]
MAGAANRPLSPHMSIWRWGPGMAISILHRATGDGMAFVGLGVLLYWLGSMAGGPESYAAFAAHAGTWYGKVVLIGLTWAFFTHMASGVRHFVLDIGAGFELKINNFWSVLTPIIAMVLTVIVWAWVLHR